MRAVLLLSIALMIQWEAYAQGRIKGIVVDAITDEAINNVIIVNAMSGASVMNAFNGTFEVDYNVGDLIEFRKEGLNTARVRIKSNHTANFYKIQLTKAIPVLQNRWREATGDYYKDSLRYAELYGRYLGKEKLSLGQTLRDPFYTYSKVYKNAMQLQETFDKIERIKYVDYTFNDKLIQKITGITGDSLKAYKKYFTPSYEALRGMTELQLLNYIKETGSRFKKGQMHRTSPSRISG